MASKGRGSLFLVAVITTIVALLLPVAVNLATGALPRSWAPYSWIAIPVSVVLTGFLILQRAREKARAEAHDRPYVPSVQTPASSAPYTTPPSARFLIPRPELLQQALAAVLRPAENRLPVLVLLGRGGFGKTTLAAEVQGDTEVVAWYGSSQMLWLTVGEETAGSDYAKRINELSFKVSGERPGWLDPMRSIRHLEGLLRPRRALIVLDDACQPHQVKPFIGKSRSYTLVVTTRYPEIASLIASEVIEVGGMTTEQATRMLHLGIAADDQHQLDMGALIRASEGSPLRLSLINTDLRIRCSRGESLPAAIEAVSHGLVGRVNVDVNVAGLGSLLSEIALTNSESGSDAFQRFIELAIFPAATSLPVRTITEYWCAIADIPADKAEQFCNRLLEANLVTSNEVAPANEPSVVIHDLLQAEIKHRLGTRVQHLHDAFLNMYRAKLPVGRDGNTAWWLMSEAEPYLWDHLVHHLRAAKRQDELDQLLCNPVWIGAKLHVRGAAAVDTDLSASRLPRVADFRRAMAQSAHLLAPMSTREQTVALLVNVLGEIPGLAAPVSDDGDRLPQARLVPVWSPPSPLRRYLLRTLTGDFGPYTRNVSCLALSPDASWFVTNDADGRLVIRDVESGTVKATLDPEFGPNESTFNDGTAMALSADGRHLAAKGPQASVQVWDTESSKAIATMQGHTSQWIQTFAFSGDGQWLASGAQDRTVRIWTAAYRLAATLNQRLIPRSLAFSPDGLLLAVAGWGGWIHIWKTGSWVLDRTITIGGSIEELLFSPDGSSLIACDNVGRGKITVFRTSDWAIARTIPHSAHVASFSPDGRYLFAGGTDGYLRAWNVGEWTLRLAIPGAHAGWITGVEVAPDGRWLATSGDTTIRIWDMPAEESEPVSTARLPEPGLMSDGAPFVSWCLQMVYGDEAVSPDRQESRSPVELADSASPRSGWRKAVAVRRMRGSGRRHAHPAELAVAGRARQTTLRHSGSPDEQTASLSSEMKEAIELLLSPLGDLLAVRFRDGIRVANLKTRRSLRLNNSSGLSAPVLAISRDGRWLAAGTRSAAVHIWDLATGSARVFTDAHSQYVWARFEDRPIRSETLGVTGVAFTPDGTSLLTGADDGTVVSWDTSTWKFRRICLEPGADHTYTGLSALAMSPNGSWVAVARSRDIKLWTASGDAVLSTISSQRGATALVVSPDSSWLATAGAPVTLWNINGALRKELMVDDGWVLALSLSPNGKLLAGVGYRNDTLWIWDVDHGTCTTSIRLDGLRGAFGWLGPTRLWVCASTGVHVFDYCS